MRRITSPAGATVSYETHGTGPPLVLVHGAFGDHRANWEFVQPLLGQRFTLHAVARRGRGQTDATDGHGVEDESRDLAAVVRAIGEPVYLLGHSYGAHVALAASSAVPDRVRAAILYEPAWPHILGPHLMDRLEALARAGHWDDFATTFFRDALTVPAAEIDALRTTPHWPPILADAPSTLGDLRALARYDFRPEQFRHLRVPTVLQIGTESPRNLYATDTLAAVLPDVRIQELPGQAHEAMTTAPAMYADAVSGALLSDAPTPRKRSSGAEPANSVY